MYVHSGISRLENPWKSAMFSVKVKSIDFENGRRREVCLGLGLGTAEEARHQHAAYQQADHGEDVARHPRGHPGFNDFADEGVH